MTNHEIFNIKQIGSILRITTKEGNIFRVQGCTENIRLTPMDELYLEVSGDSVELKQK